MNLKMTLDDALAFSDEWTRGMTLHEGSQGWRVVCLLLAEEVRRQRMAVNAEREACVKACEAIHVQPIQGAHEEYIIGKKMAIQQSVYAIRKRAAL